jgi:hypothetical protein
MKILQTRWLPMVYTVYIFVYVVNEPALQPPKLFGPRGHVHVELPVPVRLYCPAIHGGVAQSEWEMLTIYICLFLYMYIFYRCIYIIYNYVYILLYIIKYIYCFHLFRCLFLHLFMSCLLSYCHMYIYICVCVFWCLIIFVYHISVFRVCTHTTA